MNQSTLFGEAPAAPPRPPRPPAMHQRQRNEAKRRAEEGMRLAAEKAEREHEGWLVAALSFFLDYARKTEPGSTFATEDVRHASAGKLAKPANARSWGAIPKAAQKLKQVEWVEFAPTTDPNSHGCPRSAWRFIGERL